MLGDAASATARAMSMLSNVGTPPPLNPVSAMITKTGIKFTAPSPSRGQVDPDAFGVAPTSTIFGLPKMIVYTGGALVAGFIAWKFLFTGSSSSPAPLPVKTNPRRRNPSRVPVLSNTDRLRRAVERYEEFHWGDKPDRIVSKKVSKAPQVGVKLGKLVSVAYETTKRGEKAIWEHEFGEEGGKRPDLVMDADTKKLHIVGGSYDVREEGIID